MRWFFRVAVTLSALAVLLPAKALASNPPTGEREAVVWVVTRWDQGCDGSTRTSWSNMCWYWYFDLTFPLSPPLGHGSKAWIMDGFYTNSAVDSDFTDTSKVSWGRDYTNDRPDDVDVCMIALHGGNSSSDSDRRWVGQVVRDEAGSGNCGSFQGHMEFGDGDLEFLHLSSCVSMDHENWHPHWSESFKRLHQINGFHGIMYIHGDTAWLNRYRDFSDDSFDIPIALAWLDNHYRYKCATYEGTSITYRKDQCPVSRGVGVGSDGQQSCWNRMYNEEYDNVFSDPANPTWHGVMWLQGCNPSAGDALPYTTHGCTDNPPPAPSPLEPPGGIAGGREDDELPPLDRTVMPRGAYALRIRDLLPAFDASVLNVPDGPDWLRTLRIEVISRVLGDDPPDTIFADGPHTWAMDSQDRNFIKIDLDRGRVRYGNRLRRFDFVRDTHVAVPAVQAFQLAREVALGFGVPAAEMDLNDAASNVVTVGGQDYRSGDPSDIPFSTHESEQMVTIVRRINGLPVMESFVRASVSNYGAISRALVRWPQFTMQQNLTLRSRESVIGDLALQIENAQFGADSEIDIYLAYARFGFRFVPVAVAEILDPYSGQIFYAPLVELPPDRDMDGVPDAADNCPDIPNPRQEDRDNDGIGDLCDNCPFTHNPNQADSDRDGIGDVCQSPQGACRLPDGSCDVITRAQCIESDGLYAGDGTACPNLTGDMNCDGLVNNFDIDPFVLALSDPAGYHRAYPNCVLLNGDTNGDGLVNNFDIEGFVRCLSVGCP